MDLGSVCSSSFLGFVLRVLLLFISVSGDLRTNAGIGRKVPFNFYNLKNISQAGLACGRSLIEQIALYCCKRCDFAIYLPSTMAISSSVSP